MIARQGIAEVSRQLAVSGNEGPVVDLRIGAALKDVAGIRRQLPVAKRCFIGG